MISETVLLLIFLWVVLLPLPTSLKPPMQIGTDGISRHRLMPYIPLPSARRHPSYGDWRLRGNIIRTALWCIVQDNVHSLQHTYVSSSYKSNRLGLSHWDPYAVHRGSCLELYYCNMVKWFWWDSSLIFDDQLISFSALTLLVWSSGL